MIKIVVKGKILSQSKVNQKNLEEFASKLDSNLPRSEVWFRELYRPFRQNIKFKKEEKTFNRAKKIHVEDRFNKPFAGFIPDVINHCYKYIIEIDGSVHKDPHVAKKDKIKEKLYTYLGYRVFRVEAYNKASWNNFKKEFTDYALIAEPK